MKTRILLVFSLALLALSPVRLSAQADGKGAALQTIGAQGGALLYNTYCLIGAIHDGYLADTWDKDLAVRILEEQSALMLNIADRYDTLLVSSYLDVEDSLYLEDMKACCGLLRDEALTLRDYINDETDANHKEYEQARDAAWNAIEELLDLKDDDYSGTAGRKVFAGTR